MKFLYSVLLFIASSSLLLAETAELFSYEQRPEEYCLAQNIYFEARGSSRADRIAVADVVLNRVDDARYPNTICEVVRQGYREGRRDCQFSWYCDGNSDQPRDKDLWHDAQQIAFNMVVHRDCRGLTEGATHYHANYVSPAWAEDLEMVGKIGVHLFYRWE